MAEESAAKIERIHPEYTPEEKPLPPAQFNLFTGEAEPVALVIDEIFTDELRVNDDITLVKTGDASQIILSGFGLYLSKKSERLLVKKSKDVIYEFPLFRINEVIVASRGISISTDLIEELCVRGIRLNFLSGGGKPYAMISSPMLSATILARRNQFEALSDERSLKFSKAVVTGKITNQERLLRYFGKYLKASDPEKFEVVEASAESLKGLRDKISKVTGKNINESRDTLMGLEGTAGRIYWDGVKEILKQRVEFFGRERRGATDPVNSVLNYGYGILYSLVWGAVVNAGLEPFAGFMHVDRPGKPSLVLDLVEEFRQPVVDRAVIAFINLAQEIKMEGGLLDAGTRKLIGEKILERLESVESCSGKKYRIRSIIQMQARNLASFLRGERDYKPFTFKW
ncbi:MAG: CRISPR-associated endonuclease Cas1 [Nitrospirae bacterium]|nr:CRISPR-associated endonuclease Cas1 [Nitrospirota bacterium]